ncbi:uncharacterized protein LOC123037749 [Drosophila rhopaloa]|uniref:C-type lectin domain-containing protein n=1 Tax=Drosophila rhopaloa TaxID=1041015 RepID=A0ABM5JAQ5_DRORH|nr:uncharacterized protein LOC123037749 [Drosophila rhopaloa]
MNAVFLFTVCLLAFCRSEPVFDRIGDGYYYIGSEKTAGHYFDWFIARQHCRRNVSTLVSVETRDELVNLEQYIVSKGFPDGSTFATSGNSFNSPTPYSWEATDEPLAFTNWLPGTEKLPERSYLSLKLTNSSLYMIPTYGLDDYYICEYHFSIWQLWLSLDSPNRDILIVIVFFVWFCLLILYLRWQVTKKSSQPAADKVQLMSEIL